MLARLLLVGAGGAAVLGSAAATLLAIGWPRTPSGELAGSVRFPLGLATLAAILPLLAYRRWIPVLLGAVLAGAHLWPELTLFHGRSRANEPGLELRLVAANLRYGQADPDELRRFLDEYSADLVVLSEVTRPSADGTDWRAVFEAWRERFPHQVSMQGRQFSIVLLSRYPLEAVEGHAPEPPVWRDGDRWTQRRLLVETVLRLPDRSVQVFAAHFPIPFDSSTLAARTQLVERITRERSSGSAMLVGDLNATCTTPLFGDLLTRAHLRDSREGFGPCLSWRHKRFPWPLIAIDHVLVSEDLGVVDRGLGPDIGSDHLPICATLRIPPPPARPHPAAAISASAPASDR